MKKPVILSLFLALFAVFAWKWSQSSEKQTVIAITQIVEHPSLDLERTGALAALADAGYTDGKQVKIIYQNAQGSAVTATQIAQKFVSLKPDVILAISTTSAQSVLTAIGPSKIPMVFTAVTDPVGARLVKSLPHPGAGITGVSDYLPAEPQLKLLQSMIPSLKNLGIIYSPGETNSVTLVNELLAKADAFGIRIVQASAGRTSEVASAAQSLAGRVDAIYVPNDNTAVSAIDGIIQIGIKHKIPVFAGDSGSITKGAIGMAGYDRQQMGRAAGERIVQILKHGGDQDIPVQTEHAVTVLLNRSAAEKMSFALPAELPANVQWIGGAL